MKFEIYPTREGLLKRRRWRWRFRAVNHEIIEQGKAYVKRADCQYAVALLQTHAAGAKVVTLSDDKKS